MLQIAAMAGVVATWFLLAMLFFGNGILLCRLLRLGSRGWKLGARGWKDGQLVFWIGWGVSVAALQLWHLVWPVNDQAFLWLIALPGLLGLAVESPRLIAQAVHRLRATDRRVKTVAAATLLVITAFWSSLSIGPPHRGDTANYHMAGVRWSSEYAIVPGLGNLHGRLAFNNSSFLYDAAVDAGPWTGRGHHVAHGLLAVVSLLYFASQIPAAVRSTATDERRWRFPVALVPALCFPIVVRSCYKGTSSLEPDFVTFLLGMIISCVLLELLSGRRFATRSIRLRVFAVCFLSSVGLTVKLSFLPFGFAASMIALVVGVRTLSAMSRSVWPLAALCCAAAMATIVPWNVSGVILSGYPAYPSTFAGFDVEWRVPAEDARHMKNQIVGYARHHGEGYLDTLDNWDWIGPVLLRELGHPFSVTIPWVCAILSLSGLAYARRAGILRPDVSWRPWCFLVPSVAAIGFMVMTAPVPRFAGSAIWMVAIGTLVLSLHHLKRSEIHFRRGLIGAVALGAAMFVIGITKASRYVYGPGNETAFAPIPEGIVSELTTDSGLAVYVAGETGAWDAPLPNAPEFRRDLSLIRDGDLSAGFKIDSPRTAGIERAPHR